jgi:hypothetical protein
MNTTFTTLLLFALVVTCTATQPLPDRAPARTSRQSQPVSRKASFIENRGQWDRHAKFLLRSPGLDLWITADGLVYDLQQVEQSDRSAIATSLASMSGARAERPKFRVTRLPVFMTFQGASPTAEASGVDPQEGYCNYFVDNDPTKWATSVPRYGGASLRRIYNGIDALFYLDGDRPRYDLIVAPGADPAMIRIKVEGAEGLSVDADGSLLIRTGLGDIRQQGLLAYQIVGGLKQQVRCAFVERQRNIVEFMLGGYDRRRPLVIDPLVYSTYLGGIRTESGGAIAVDGAGNAYVTGSTYSANFPKLHPYQSSLGSSSYDAFVTKLDARGGLVYSTYLGGDNDDFGGGIAVDGSGNAYVTGNTLSGDFPTASAFQKTLGGGTDGDLFVTKLAGGGDAVVYSTYLGGSSGELGASYGSIAVDGSGNVYVTGNTRSDNFPISSNAFQPEYAGGPSFGDGFVTKFNSSGDGLVYSSFLGGSRDEISHAIAVDDNGNAYVTGETLSTDFPTSSNAFQPSTGGTYDAFVAKISSGGSPLYSSYLGGSAADYGYGIAVDAKGDAFVFGDTYSGDFPTVAPYQGVKGASAELFIAEVGSNGSSLLYSTYLGGDSNDYAGGIALDRDGNVYMTGQTNSRSFPMMNAYQSKYGGGYDAYVSKLGSSGKELLYSTYLGGSAEENAHGIAVDGNGGLYVTGFTSSTDFPTVNAYQSSYGSGGDAFVTKLSTSQSGSVDPSGRFPEADLILHPLQPNPIIDGALHLDFALATSSNVTVEVFAIDGRLLSRPILDRRYEAGSHSEQVGVGELPSGGYIVRLRTAGSERAASFVVEH